MGAPRVSVLNGGAQRGASYGGCPTTPTGGVGINVIEQKELYHNGISDAV